MEVQNLLPHDVRYRIFDKNLEHNWTSFLRAGGVSPIHVAELSHLLLLSIEIQETSAFRNPAPILSLGQHVDASSVIELGRSEFAIINTDNPEDLPVESDLILADQGGHKLGLRIHYQYVYCFTITSASGLDIASTAGNTPIRAEPTKFRSMRLTRSSTRPAFPSPSRPNRSSEARRASPAWRNSPRNRRSGSRAIPSCSPIPPTIAGIARCSALEIRAGLALSASRLWA